MKSKLPEACGCLKKENPAAARGREFWWRIRDSNPGHKDYDSSALTD